MVGTEPLHGPRMHALRDHRTAEGCFLPLAAAPGLHAANVRREMEPLVGYTTSLLIGASCWPWPCGSAGSLPLPIPAQSPTGFAAGHVQYHGGTVCHCQPPKSADPGARLPRNGKRHLRVRPRLCPERAAAGGTRHFARCVYGRFCDGNHDFPYQPGIRSYGHGSAERLEEIDHDDSAFDSSPAAAGAAGLFSAFRPVSRGHCFCSTAADAHRADRPGMAAPTRSRSWRLAAASTTWGCSS